MTSKEATVNTTTDKPRVVIPIAVSPDKSQIDIPTNYLVIRATTPKPQNPKTPKPQNPMLLNLFIVIFLFYLPHFLCTQ